MFRIILKPFAENDATTAAKWYNDARDGLGSEFLLALDAKLNAIKRNPHQFQIIHRNIRRALTERFPFGIFYTVEDNTIYILAILHLHRNPNTWKR